MSGVTKIEARDIRLKDEIYDKNYCMAKFGRPWVVVTEIETSLKAIKVTTTSGCTHHFHPLKGVAVRRGEGREEL